MREASVYISSKEILRAQLYVKSMVLTVSKKCKKIKLNMKLKYYIFDHRNEKVRININ